MSEILESVIATYKKRPAAAILMSGSGSNAETLLGNEAIRDLYDIRLIFSDNPLSRGEEIADQHGLYYAVDPVTRFRSREEREEYFDQALQTFAKHGVGAAIYAGFMKITSKRFCYEMPGVNVHPADLTITNEHGVAKYRGMSALPDMRRKEGYVASSLHVADVPVDTGSVIAVTSRVTCPSEVSDADCHNALKAHEHVLYPLGLTILGQGLINAGDEPRRIDTWR